MAHRRMINAAATPPEPEAAYCPRCAQDKKRVALEQEPGGRLWYHALGSGPRSPNCHVTSYPERPKVKQTEARG